jgi:protease-4
MKSFFLKILKNVAALLLAYAVFFAVILVTFVVLGVLLEDQGVAIEDDSVLVFDLSVSIPDSPEEVDPLRFMERTLGGRSARGIYLKAALDGIERAGTDDRIKGLFLHGNLQSNNYGSSFSSIRELTGKVQAFRATGKPVVAYLINPSLKDYALAACADEVIIHPFGLLMLKGLAAELMFFGNAFEKYGIGMQVTQLGKYKSIGETFTQDRMSAESRAQTGLLLESLWNAILGDVSENRGIDLDALRAMTEEQGVFTATEALEQGLVDRIGYFDEVLDRLSDIGEYDAQASSVRQVGLTEYHFADSHLRKALENDRKTPKIAVVYLEGDIVNGEGRIGQVGATSLSRKLRSIRTDDLTKAVVLRVNSPGGSAVAAEIIEREISLIHEEKPVVVSMGGYAASGGYWVSANADTIIADETTITGSIGVFGLYPNIEKIASDHGITFDGVKTSQYADILTVSRPKSVDELALLRALALQIYDVFISKVSEGRKLSVEQVSAIAEGRVWSGEDAVRIGLVDKMGGLMDAIEEAAALADLGENYRVVQEPDESALGDIVTRILGGGDAGGPLSSMDPLTLAWRSLLGKMPFLQSLDDPRGVYARLPYLLRVH